MHGDCSSYDEQLSASVVRSLGRFRLQTSIPRTSWLASPDDPGPEAYTRTFAHGARNPTTTTSMARLSIHGCAIGGYPCWLPTTTRTARAMRYLPGPALLQELYQRDTR